MKIAIVGSEEKYWTSEQRTKVISKIKEIFLKHADRLIDNDDYDLRPPMYFDITLVSGGCPKGGVDIWAEVVADTLGIKKEIYKPETWQWEDKQTNLMDEKLVSKGINNGFVKLLGYRSRNIKIAEACDILYCIDAKGRKRSGGMWTLNYAKKLGKEVHLELI